jgi:hypothetical protein
MTEYMVSTLEGGIALEWCETHVECGPQRTLQQNQEIVLPEGDTNIRTRRVSHQTWFASGKRKKIDHSIIISYESQLHIIYFNQSCNRVPIFGL